jgi:hypothetical protein
MTTINSTQGSGNKNFRQIEEASRLSSHLPAICAGTVIAVVLLLAISCSKKSDKPVTSISPPATTVTTGSAPSTAAVIPEAPKKAKKHRPANATYVNGVYGLSFSYPRKYSLQVADKQASLVPVQANFLEVGAVQVASVDMPDDSYPDTDFSSALLNVSVNPSMTAEQCGQFLPSSKADAAKPTSVKLGGNEFTELEQMNEEANRQSDVKYFHLFKNGACYEFALEVETSRKADEELAQVDRGKIFQQLEKILTTARIKNVDLPGVENAEKLASTGARETSSAQVGAPVQK